VTFEENGKRADMIDVSDKRIRILGMKELEM